MTSHKRIAFVGECMIELRGQPLDSIQAGFGGDTLNSALYCSRVAGDNLHTYYVTALGVDAYSEAMLGAWDDEGIDTSLVQKFSHYQPGIYSVALDAEGERSFCYWRSQSAARYLIAHPKFPETVKQLESFSCVVFSGISLAILHGREEFISHIRRLKDQGVCVVFDTNYRPALWKDSSEAQYWCEQALRVCDIALVTFDDEVLLWGDASPEHSCKRMHALGIEKVIVKLGKEGAVFSEASSAAEMDLRLVPAIYVENVCDTTAAGDSFNAGFLAAYWNGESVENACKQGHQIASQVVQHSGAIIPRAVSLNVGR